MLVAAAAGGIFLVLVALRRRKADDPAVQTVAAVAAPVGAASPVSTAPVESQVPRWLRPSVRAARFESDNIKAPRPQSPRLAFATPGDEVAERLVVRYDLVQLLDRPDEALGVPHGELNSGDEIEVLERDDVWTRVQTPTGRAGWVPAMTLASADALGEPGAETPPAAEIDGADGQGDEPALETLLAIAAARRARVDAQSPALSRPDRTRKARKADRRASSRAERT